MKNMIVFIAFIAFCFNVTFGQRVTSEEAILKAFQFANRYLFCENYFHQRRIIINKKNS